MVSDRGRGCKGSKTTYFLEIGMERDGVRLWMRTQREHDNVLPGWRGSVMVSDHRRKYQGRKTTYFLQVERERDGGHERIGPQ